MLFFPIVCFIYFLLPNNFLKKLCLLGASYVFYSGWGIKYAFLLLGMTVFSYFVGLVLDSLKDKKSKLHTLTLVISLLLLFGILCVFKYTSLIVDTINNLVGSGEILLTGFSIVLPVGISFYTFQITSYVIDVYRGNTVAERDFISYALYVSFFPQLVAGPIELSTNFLKQMKEPHTFDYERAKKGLVIMLWGYFLKLVIADRAAKVVDTVYGNAGSYSGIILIVATFLFAIQLYCDFAGYSTIALGAAKVLGFTMTDNFQAPFLSQSVSELWRRWHVSLNVWFREYMYIPLGGNRKGVVRKYINVIFVCVVSGLWHGANWTFAIWGFMNGFYQMLGAVTKSFRIKCQKILKIKEPILYYVLRPLGVFFLFGTSLVFFRADSISTAVGIYRNIFTKFAAGFEAESLLNLGCSAKTLTVLFLAIALLYITDFFKYRGKNIWLSLTEKSRVVQWPVYILMILSILLFGVYGKDSSAFIYFVF